MMPPPLELPLKDLQTIKQGWPTPVLKGHQQVRFSGYPSFSRGGSIRPCSSTGGSVPASAHADQSVPASAEVAQSEAQSLTEPLIDPPVLKLGYPENLTCFFGGGEGVLEDWS
ncbi:hypothetical protein FKM82_022167 [Ascaphus truei]